MTWKYPSCRTEAALRQIGRFVWFLGNGKFVFFWGLFHGLVGEAGNGRRNDFCRMGKFWREKDPFLNISDRLL